ncbi:SapC family protein [Martelella sp. AD-3]|uniref:SapC family protein n=1 Tax=Martelella sp. AD-3 TaxID=686597 RepID=UPI00046447A0|nr:SapC family protein [Martelella sp. AD-3]AMM85977.1 hypothetical protein AZF01_17810 [Martelella sp. AD-3]
MKNNGLPLFYSAPQVLRFEDHKDLVLERKQDFSFAAKANAVPLSPAEFVPASRHYPIVFVKGDPLPTAVAVTGLKEGQNLFVDSAGAWQAGVYIPAYVRRYPFILIQSEDKSQTVLGFDEGCDRIKPADEAENGSALFAEDGKAGEATAPMMEFCNSFHQASLRGNDFAKALKEQDLLVDKQVNMSFANKSHYRLDGLLVVDEDRFRNLPQDVLIDWHKNGFNDAVVLHLASTQNWQVLLELNEKASPAKAA